MKHIIVGHPEKQHSYRTTEAVNKAGMLDRYITMVYCKKKSFTNVLDCITGHKYRLNIIKKNPSIDDSKIQQFCELRGLFLLIMRRMNFRRITDQLQYRIFNAFGKRVARYAKNHNIDAVIMYDNASLVCFEELANTGIVRIMDVSSANFVYTGTIRERLAEDLKNASINVSKEDIFVKAYSIKERIDEIRLTDHFIVPSQFVKKSIMFSGVDAEKIHIVPYGVDTELFRYSERRTNITEGSLELLFVAECTYLKGIGYLLEAVNNCKESVKLTIVGGYQKILPLYKMYHECQNICFLGRVPHDQLTSIYQKADVFVLPSLSEGMSRVGLEAMACGLPLLCSLNSGINDLVQEGRNGWILPEISSMAIEGQLKVILEERKNLIEMGREARITAEKYTWNNYAETMKRTLLKILEC